MNNPVHHRAYHALRLSNGQLIQGPVSVSFDAEGNVISWHLLDSEEPFTEWVGGVLNTPFIT